MLFVVDTLRADHLGVHGYQRPTSPEIDAFAADSIRFSQALAPSPWTLPSLATLMTSLYPAVHGANKRSRLGELDWLFEPGSFRPTRALHASRTRMAELLQAQGFATLGLVQGAYPSAVFGFAKGVDRYDENASPGVRFDVEEALHWLDSEKPERFFVYIHVKEVHSPYSPNDIRVTVNHRRSAVSTQQYRAGAKEERERFEQIDFDPGYAGRVDGSLKSLQRMKKQLPKQAAGDIYHLVALYDRGIRYVDHWFGALIGGLRERGLLNETVVLFTSDHGEEFLEHGGLEHGHTYYEEMLRVPLILRIPGQAHGTVIDDAVGLVDVLPTVLEVLGVEAQYPTQGRSLVPLWTGGSLEPRSYFGEASNDDGRMALRADGFKYVRNKARPDELYVLSEDPGERFDRCRLRRKLCKSYRRKLKAWVKQQAQFAALLALPEAQDVVIDDEMAERLRSMGYVD